MKVMNENQVERVEALDIPAREDRFRRLLRQIACICCKPHRGENRRHGQNSKDRKPRYKNHRPRKVANT